MPWLLASGANGLAVARQRPEGVQGFQLLLFAVAVLTLAAYGYAAAFAVPKETLDRQHRALARLRTGGTRVLIAILVVKACYVVVRLAVAPNLFGDDRLWTLARQSPLAWIGAAATATVIGWVAFRSERRPLARSGWVDATTALVIVGGLHVILDLVDASIMWIWLVVDPSAQAEVARFLQAVGPLFAISENLRLLGAVGLAVAGVIRWRRGDRWNAGTVLLLLAAAWLLPTTAARIFPGLVAHTALPTQVDIVLTVGVVAVLVARGPGARWLPRQLLSRLEGTDPLLLRLVVVPLVAVQVAALVPEIWQDQSVTAVTLLLVVLALLGLPRVAADVRRRSRTLLLASAGQLAALTAFLLTAITNNVQLLTGLSIYTDLVVLLLAVPVAALLCCRVQEVPSPSQPPTAVSPDSRQESGPVLGGARPAGGPTPSTTNAADTTGDAAP
jgi:hypothetical protein